MPPEAVVEFRNVNYKVGDRLILDSLTLSVAAGETLVLLGRSGSGKTTALRLINGMIRRRRAKCSWTGKATTAWRSGLNCGAASAM